DRQAHHLRRRQAGRRHRLTMRGKGACMPFPHLTLASSPQTNRWLQPTMIDRRWILSLAMTAGAPASASAQTPTPGADGASAATYVQIVSHEADRRVDVLV